MAAIISTLQPEYLDSTRTLADLPIDGDDGFPFTFSVNITAARFAQYQYFLRLAGVE